MNREKLILLPLILYFFCGEYKSGNTTISTVLEVPNIKRIPPCFQLPESRTVILNEMVANRIYLGGAEWSRFWPYYDCVHVTPEIEANLAITRSVTAEDALVKERKLIGRNKNYNGATLENYNTAPRMDATNWFLSGLYEWFDIYMQPIWDSMDLVLGQFMLTPVAAYNSVIWRERMDIGENGKDSTHCKMMEGFQSALVGLETRSIVVSAGSTSYSCTNAVIAKRITDAFSNPGSTAVDWFCDGADWNVGKCGGGEIMVDNHEDSNICTCNGALTIRPCHDGDSWGGTGGGCKQDTTTLSVVVYYGTSFAPTPNPTYSPINPTGTPTSEPTAMPTKSLTAAPSAMSTEIKLTHNVTNGLNDFNRIDKDGNGVLKYEEIIFDIADVNKDGDLSPDEYLAARADGFYTETSSTK